MKIINFNLVESLLQLDRFGSWVVSVVKPEIKPIQDDVYKGFIYNIPNLAAIGSGGGGGTSTTTSSSLNYYVSPSSITWHSANGSTVTLYGN